MENTYTIGEKLEWFSFLDIGSKDYNTGDNIVIIIDNQTKEDLVNYYSYIKQLLKDNIRLLFVQIGELGYVGKSIANLLVSYGCYNIYIIENREILNAEYISKLLKREPSIFEIENYLDKDISAYSELSTLLLGIEELVYNGDLEGLKEYAEENIQLLTSCSSILDYLKGIVDNYNNENYNEIINNLNSNIEELTSKLELSYKSYKKLKNELEDSNNKLELANRTINSLYDGEEIESSNEAIFKNYNTLNTSLIKCRTKIIIYFKEVGTIPYINTLISSLYEFLVLKKLKAKLLIYDNKIGFSGVYKPLNIVGSEEYLSKRDNYISRVNKFVVVEPNQAIIDDIIKSNNPEFDVVIIYDRMKQLNDIVSGNNVYKFWVVNSKKDLEAISSFKVNYANIITREEENLDGKYLSIGKIEEYGDMSSSAKLKKYMGLSCKHNGKEIKLVQTIFSRSNVSKIIS